MTTKGHCESSVRDWNITIDNVIGHSGDVLLGRHNHSPPSQLNAF